MTGADIILFLLFALLAFFIHGFIRSISRLFGHKKTLDYSSILEKTKQRLRRETAIGQPDDVIEITETTIENGIIRIRTIKKMNKE